MRKLAVIMSLYKNDKLEFLKIAIESVLNQTFSEFNLYIKFDGIIAPECESYLKSLSDSRVILSVRKENKGLAVSLNELIQDISSKNYTYIARMDADDICIKDRFEKQISFMDKHKNVDISGGNIEEINEKGESICKIHYPLEHKEMLEFFGSRNPLAHMTVMFRKTYIDKTGLYPEDTFLDEDTMYWFNGFINNCVFANIEDVLVLVRVNSEFYGRRNGFSKSYNDLKNRIKIIKTLHLSYVNYLLAVSRFIIMIIPMAKLTRFAYLYMRK